MQKTQNKKKWPKFTPFACPTMEKNHRIKMGIYKNFPKIDKIPTALHEEEKKGNLESTKDKVKGQKKIPV